MTATLLTCTEAEYHADPCPVSLSYSTAKELILRSPLHAWWTHSRLGGNRKGASKAMAAGDSLDRLLFGGEERLEVIEAPDYRTKLAQQARDAAIEGGKTPVLKHVHDGHLSLANLVRESVLQTTGYDLTTCDHQVSIAWQEPLQCRTRLDALTPDCAWIFDLKTGSNGDPDWLERHIRDQGWDIQAAAELEAVHALYPETAGRIRFADIVVEDGTEHNKPSCVTVVEICGSLLAYGQSRWRRAKKLWDRCLSSGDWPPYSTTIIAPQCSSWAMAQEQEHGWE